MIVLVYFLLFCLVRGIPNVLFRDESSNLIYVELPPNVDYNRRDPSQEFSSYQQIYPKFQHTRHKNMNPDTHNEDGNHMDEIVIHFDYGGRTIICDLHLNTDLLPTDHFLKYQSSNGDDVVLTKFDRATAELCHYQGHIRDNRNSRVAISTCRGLHGILIDDSNTFYIASALSTDQVRHDHFIHRLTRNTQFSSDRQTPQKANYTRATSQNSRRKRSAKETFYSSYQSNQYSSYVELVMVADNSLFKAHQTVEKVHEYCKSLVNIINTLYMPLNIFVVLTGVEVWNLKNKISVTSNALATLKQFSDYLLQEPNNGYDNAQLLVGTPIQSEAHQAIVGKANYRAMCSYKDSVSIVHQYSSNIGAVASTAAHEIGHILGLDHDVEDRPCSGEICIMTNTSAESGPTNWSSRSINQLIAAFRDGANYCLKNKPKRLYVSTTCGNGLVEDGEQCDCGKPSVCTNRCCDPATCKLRPHAACATGTCCDLSTCRLRDPGYECRSAEPSECDLPEHCTGKSEHCPNDYYRRDTEPCNNGKAFCYNGACRSHDDQCQLLYGPFGRSSPLCYQSNTNGALHSGDCGYNIGTKEYKQCDHSDILCGRLQCRNRGENLEMYQHVKLETRSRLSPNGRISQEPCIWSTFNTKQQSDDPGMTPNGARCGPMSMCLKQKCRKLRSLWKEGIGRKCENNCSGNGRCDNTGGCYCDIGFGGKHCNVWGPGGSKHGGPASNPDVHAVVPEIPFSPEVVVEPESFTFLPEVPPAISEVTTIQVNPPSQRDFAVSNDIQQQDGIGLLFVLLATFLCFILFVGLLLVLVHFKLQIQQWFKWAESASSAELFSSQISVISIKETTMRTPNEMTGRADFSKILAKLEHIGQQIKYK